MRLKAKEINSIKKVVNQFFKDAQIYIYGSQLDDSKRGGDIDIYIIPKDREKLLQKESKIKFLLQHMLYKPIDILIHRDFARDIEKEAQKGVQI
jgi:predicted nucleotidyltransferase